MNLESRLSSGLWDAVRLSYASGNFTAAIQDALYQLSDVLRAKSGLEGDGASLVGQALGGSTPLIRVTPLQSESELNVQRGMEQLLRGLYQAIRNPRSHGKVIDTEQDAQVIILFVDYVLRIIGASKSPFSLAEYIDRVLDPDFVAKDRYADLLVEKLPPKYRLEVFHELFKRRTEVKGQKLRTYFNSLLKVLTPDERAEVARGVSLELELAHDDASIRSIIETLGAALWREVDELPRLRIENKLLDEIRSGRYNIQRKRCDSGALGTWTQTIVKDFGPKGELGSLLLTKLESDDESQREYVYQYFMSHLDSIYEKPPGRVKLIILNRLGSGDLRFKEALESAYLWREIGWTESIQTALDEFTPQQPTINPFDVEDDDLPF